MRTLPDPTAIPVGTHPADGRLMHEPSTFRMSRAELAAYLDAGRRAYDLASGRAPQLQSILDTGARGQVDTTPAPLSRARVAEILAELARAAGLDAAEREAIAVVLNGCAERRASARQAKSSGKGQRTPPAAPLEHAPAPADRARLRLVPKGSK